MDWFTLEWLMKNLEWAVGLLVVGCLVLFLFPIFLGYDLKKKADNQKLIKIIEKSNDIRLMSVDEYKIYIDDYIKKSKFPDIN